MKESILKTKSYDFSLLIIKSYQLISSTKKEFTLSKQLLRSGTSIGANIREANETDYWISLMYDSNYMEVNAYKTLTFSNKELIKMLVSTINTMKAKTN